MSMARKDSMCRRDVLVLLGTAALAALAPAQTRSAAKKTSTTQETALEKIEAKSTLENLQTAFMGESNASARYAAFAKKADEEGYGKVASLFRAAAKAESIHAAKHAAVITRMGGKPGVVEGKPFKPDAPEVKSTRENLQAAIKGETYEFKVMYPAFVAVARADRNTAALRTLNGARQVEQGHAKLYQEALANLEAWKVPGQNFYVCKVCGNTVAEVNFKKCPICDVDKSEYVAVK